MPPASDPSLSPSHSSLTVGEIELARADAVRAWKILDACPDAVFTLHENGRILNLNTAARKVLGYTEARGQPTTFCAVVVFPPAWNATLPAMMGRVWEFTGRRQDGSFFPCELTITRPDVDQAPVFTAYLRDITERKRGEQALRDAERALKELNLDLETKIADRTRALEDEIVERRTMEKALSQSEQRFRAIVETQVELVSRYTPDGTVTYVNPAHERFYGSKPDEYLGQNWIALIPPQLAETVRGKIAALTPEAPVFELVHAKEVPHSHRKTCEHWVNRGLFDEFGTLKEIQAVGRDITEMANTEQRRQESEAKFRRLFEETHAGVVLIDGATVVEVNPAGLKLFGLINASQAEGHSLLEFSATHQADGTPSANAIAQIAHLRVKDGSSRFEWICCNQQGREFPIEAFSSTVEIGGRTLALAILQDITDRKRAETELRNALEHERELSQLKSNFISMVSHEYRNPLGIILSSTELLKRYQEKLSQTERLESLLDIEVATRRMTGMIDNLLLMGKADAGKLVMAPKPIDLLEFCQVVINECVSSGDPTRRVRFDAHGIDIAAIADEQILRTILANLLTNALKYSPPDHSPILTLTRVGRHAVFKIHDDGIGIPDADRPALFQAFRRASNVGLVSGTGLGLYIVKHCVDLHEGTVEVESALGKGTTMTLTLPLFSSSSDARSSTHRIISNR